jgi:membrane-associated phospholipid phosphatase
MNRLALVRPTSTSRTGLIVAAWITIAILCLPWDLPLARAAHAGVVPADLRALLHRAEVFGHAYGALGIMVTVYLLDPPRRRRLVHVLASFLAAGLASDAVKLQVWRMRPRNYIESELSGSTFVGTVWTDWPVDWAWLMDHAHHSFPSAHTSAGVAMAWSLGRLYPAGRTWFYVLAGLCALSRIDGEAHFASDVCVGAALGYWIAASLPSAERMEGWWDRRRVQTRRSDAPGPQRGARAA